MFPSILFRTLYDLAFLIVPISYISGIALLIMLQRYFACKKSRFEKILPVLVLFVTVLVAIFLLHDMSKQNNKNTGVNVSTLEIYKNKPYESSLLGNLQVVMGGNRKEEVLAIGKLIVGSHKKFQFYDVSVTDGKVMIEGAPSGYAKCVERSIVARVGKDFYQYSGKTVSYQKLANIAENSVYYYKMGTDFEGIMVIYIQTSVLLFLPWILMMADSAVRSMQRRKKNRLLKTRLDDI